MKEKNEEQILFEMMKNSIKDFLISLMKSKSDDSNVDRNLFLKIANLTEEENKKLSESIESKSDHIAKTFLKILKDERKIESNLSENQFKNYMIKAMKECKIGKDNYFNKGKLPR